MKDITVLKAKRLDVSGCHSRTTLRQAARRMAEEDISALVVTDDAGYLVGLVSRTDLVRAHQVGDEWGKQPVESIMSRPVITVTPQHTLSQVADLLLQRHVHRVVVVQEEDGKLRPISVVSSADLVYHMAKES